MKKKLLKLLGWFLGVKIIFSMLTIFQAACIAFGLWFLFDILVPLIIKIADTRRENRNNNAELIKKLEENTGEDKQRSGFYDGFWLIGENHHDIDLGGHDHGPGPDGPGGPDHF